MVRTYTCRLYPTRAQAAALRTRLDAACERYNATLEELYRVWAQQGCTSGEPVAADPVAGGRRVDRSSLPGAVVDDVVHRAEQAFSAFLLKCHSRWTTAAGSSTVRVAHVSRLVLIHARRA
jgi:hypothetical protein